MKGLGESFSPNVATGTGSYSIPIEVPPGYLQPGVTLSYTGGSGRGILGVGWQYEPLQIYRMRDKGAPQFNEDDRFAVRGSGMNDELVPVNDEAGYYRLKNEGAYVRFVRDSHADSWLLEMPNGERAYLGANAGSREHSNGRAYRWFLTRMEDPFGHVAAYEYFEDGGRLYPSAIHYQLHAAAQFQNHVVMHYEQRPDSMADFSYGHECRTDLRMERIVIAHGSRTLRTYSFTYSDDDLYSLLRTVTMVGEDQLAVPPLTFSYTTDDTARARLVAMESAPPLEGLDDGAAVLDDVNGDGLPDLLYGEAGNYYYYENIDGEAWDPDARSLTGDPDRDFRDEDVSFADINGDGFRDVVHAQGEGFRYYPAEIPSRGQLRGFGEPVALRASGLGVDFGSSTVEMVDLDADGRTDLLWQKPGLDARIMNGKDDFLREQAIPELPVDADFEDPRVQLVDLNGDSELDLVLLDLSYTESQIRVWFGMGHGRYSAERSMPGAPLGELEEFRFMDVNHDGQADLVRVSGSWATYYLNDGNRFTPARANLNGLPSTAETRRLLSADMNGNGSTDLVWLTHDNQLLYFDLIGDPHAGLLARIDNGMGLVTTVSYRSTTELMVEAKLESDEGPWVHPMRTPIPVLVELSTTDSLELLGVAGSRTRTTIDYRDGYYDAKEREFRGFARSTQVEWGDEEQTRPGQRPKHESLVTEYRMHVGRDPETGADQEILKGNPFLIITRNLAGEIFQTTEARWEERLLCQEDLTGVATRILPLCARFPDKEEAKDQLIHLAVKTQVLTGSWEKVGAARYTGQVTEVDEWGKEIRSIDYGEIAFAGPREAGEPFDIERANVAIGDDESIQESDLFYLPDQWLLALESEARTREIDGTLLRATRSYYDGLSVLGRADAGLRTLETAWVSTGSCAPTSASCWPARQRVTYNAAGAVVARQDANGNTEELDYDPETELFLVLERKLVPSGYLEFRTEVDHARGVLTRRTDANGASTHVLHDGLGRVVATVGPLDSFDVPSIVYDYQFGTPSRPISTTTTWVLQDRDAPPEPAIDHPLLRGRPRGRYRAVHHYMDAGGGIRLEKRQAETGVGFIGVGWNTLSPRAEPVEAFEPFASHSGAFEAPPTGAARVTTYFDAMTRSVAMELPPTAQNGQTQSRTEYGRFETRSFSERDIIEGGGLSSTVMRSDGQGRLVALEMTNPQTPEGTPLRWTVSYNAAGDITAIRDPGYFNPSRADRETRHTRSYHYDSLGRIVLLRDPSLGSIEYTHDGVGHMISRTDARGHAQRWQYDSANRVTRHELYRSGSVVPDSIRRYHYDLPDPSGPLASTTFARGQLSWVEFPTGTQHFSYSAEGRVIEKAMALWDPATSNFEDQDRDVFRSAVHYDAEGEPTLQEQPGGLTVSIERNERRLPTAVSAGFDGDLQEVISNVAYTARATVLRADHGNGIRSCYSYDERAQLTGSLSAPAADCSQVGVASNVGFRHHRLVRGPDDRIDAIEDLSAPGGIAPRTTKAFQYDRADQLTRVDTVIGEGPTQQTYQHRYAYDEIQSLIRSETTAPHGDMPTGTFTYGAGEASPSALTGYGTTTLEYDEGGFLREYRGYELDFDPEGRLASATSPTVDVRNHYDALGVLRVSVITRAGDPSSHVYRYPTDGFEERDGAAVWLIEAGDAQVELTESPGLRVDQFLLDELIGYVNGQSTQKPLPEEYMDLAGDGGGFGLLDLAVASVGFATGLPVGGPRRLTRYYHRDYLSTTTHITDSVGDVVAYRDFHPYGKIFARTGMGGTRSFAGAEEPVVPELGLLRMGLRYYAPDLGRWISPDYVMGESPGGMLVSPLETNLYSYAGNHPNIAFDPAGDEELGFWGYVGAGLQVVGGGLEMAAGAAGIAAPTGVTQVLGVVAVVHGADTASAGLTAIITGQTTETLTHRAIASGAEAAGASPETAHTIATVGDATIGIVATAGSSALRSAAPRTAPSTVVRPPAARPPVPPRPPRPPSTAPPPPPRPPPTAPRPPAPPATGCPGGICPCFVAGTLVATLVGTVPIDAVALGTRVPPAADACEEADVDDWLRVELELDGTEEHPDDHFTIELLRPREWVDELDVVVGGSVFLELNELSVSGQARVTAIGAGPGDDGGSGCPVTGTITHTGYDFASLHLEGERVPLVATVEHPLFSATRDAWVGVGDLERGEQLVTRDGVRRVRSVAQYPGQQTVFNLEVFGSHNYYVHDAEVLAHNQCSAAQLAANAARGRAFENAARNAMGAAKNTTAVTGATRTGGVGRAIPDTLVNGFTEIKDVLDLSLTRQLHIMADAARTNGVAFNLVVSPRTRSISQPLVQAVQNSGGTIRVFDSITGTFSAWVP